MNFRKRSISAFLLVVSLVPICGLADDEAKTGSDSNSSLNVPTGDKPKMDNASNAEAKSDDAEKAKAPVGLITNNRDKKFNISRFQLRVTDKGNYNFTQSIFYRFSNKMFLAQAYEYRKDIDQDPDFNAVVWNIGGPVNFFNKEDELFDWVIRGQYATRTDDTYSYGLQYNITQMASLQNFSKANKITSFIQVFPDKSNSAQGDWDALWYYSFPLYRSIYLRGNSYFVKFYHQSNYIRSFQDIVYPINPDLDVYIRSDYQSRNDVQFGVRGTQYSVGVRVNVSF